jgi:hypothetical protein
MQRLVKYISFFVANIRHEMVLGKGALPRWGRWYEVDIAVIYKKGRLTSSWTRRQEFYKHKLQKTYYSNTTCIGKQLRASTILIAH